MCWPSLACGFTLIKITFGIIAVITALMTFSMGAATYARVAGRASGVLIMAFLVFAVVWFFKLGPAMSASGGGASKVFLWFNRLMALVMGLLIVFVLYSLIDHPNGIRQTAFAVLVIGQHARRQRADAQTRLR